MKLVKLKEAILLVCGHLFLPAITGAVIRIGYFRFLNISKISSGVIFTRNHFVVMLIPNLLIESPS